MNIKAGLAALSAVALLGAALFYGTRGGGTPPGPDPAPTPGTSAPLPAERAAVEVIFTRLGPRKAELVLKVPGRQDLKLGDLEVAQDGHVMGQALVKIPTKARGIALRRVVLKVPAGIDPRVTQAAQTLLIRGGAGSTEVAPISSS